MADDIELLQHELNEAQELLERCYRDDILTNLFICAWDLSSSGDTSCLVEAADEIKRLRTELAGVQRHFRKMQAALSDAGAWIEKADHG